ncbi:MAG: hypothetical protein ACK4RN_07520 [Pseudorhodobacter sp.]
MVLTQAIPAPAEAQQRQGHRGGKPAIVQQHHFHYATPNRRAVQPQQHRGPRIGQHARNGRVWHQGPRHRVGPPPRGQHYRVIDNRVVRVDNNTLQIVAIAGLLSALLR